MIITRSEPYILFVHVPKTGGRALKIWINNETDTTFINFFGHSTFEEIKTLTKRRLDLNKYFKFSLVRNPYDRAYSLYEYVKRQKIYEGSFENFFKNEIHKLPNKMWGDTMTNYLKGGLDVVFKYEKYPEMISFLKNKFGFNGDPNWANTDPENNVNEVQNFKYSEMYEQNKHWVPIINEVYKDDFENFDYKMLPW